MLKQTSKLNHDIIAYVIEDEKVNKLLRARDNSPLANALQLNCRFYRRHSRHKHKFGYIVDFLYSTKNNEKEESDDISVLVEVTNVEPVTFKIVGIRKY